MYRFDALTDHDFELLVADLFGTAERRDYEVFARGPDLGVDLRRDDNDGLTVVQCKQYSHSTVSNLRTAARAEQKKLLKLGRKPTSYRFVTSKALTPRNKRDLKSDLAPFIKSESDVIGADDLTLLLNKHDEVQRRHIKLWLSSSSQLNALLSSATYSRSRALAEEINEALPRWVPVNRFFRAREVLIEHHVCVIAGVPGIGKTTLAKMLLADAIHEGFDPISVSSDIDEAWAVFEPGRRQAFYYDDFLGRTALPDRSLKNEEDRLLKFMRTAVSSQTTRFLLTTREYILQQAADLYEQLAVHGVAERRFLLELQDYSRTDRARIFYNHASFSPNLSKDARKALLAGQSYKKIIDHPKYNPRTIEWITGLSGRELTADDTANYVDFAVENLSDPTLIWRHAFENQLSAAQRTLLLALATMPDLTEESHLERAFSKLADAVGVSTNNRTFERALKVLDDSFVRTTQNKGHIFIEPYDPSVEDFLHGYLRASKADARAAVRGAAFFEQIQSLSRILRARNLDDPEEAAEFLDALERSLDAPSCSWRTIFYSTAPTEPVVITNPVAIEERINFLGQVRRWRHGFAEESNRSRVRDMYSDRKRQILEAWSEGHGSEDEGLELLDGMKSRGEGIAAMALAFKGLLIGSLDYSYAFSRLIELRNLEPSLFATGEWSELGERYLEVAYEELDNWDQMRTIDDIDQLEIYARQMDVRLSSYAVDAARDGLEQSIAEAERHASTPQLDAAEEEPDDESGAELIEAMFTGLADQ